MGEFLKNQPSPHTDSPRRASDITPNRRFLSGYAYAHLLSAIRTVQRGLRYVDSELASGLFQEVVGGDAIGTKEGGGESKILSDRELQVLKLVAEGFSSREIASRIYVST